MTEQQRRAIREWERSILHGGPEVPTRLFLGLVGVPPRRAFEDEA